MARLLKAELVLLLILAFALGAVLFMYSKARSEVSVLEADNRQLTKKMMENDSETKAFLYKKRLAESDVQYMRQEESERVKEISSLTQQVEELKKQLVGDSITAS